MDKRCWCPQRRREAFETEKEERPILWTGYPRKLSNSSFSVGSSPLGSTGPALVLDTGTTVNIFKDKSLFTSTSPCDEVVYGVGGDKYQVKLKGTSEWGDALHVPTCPHNLISFRSLVDLDYAGEWSVIP